MEECRWRATMEGGLPQQACLIWGVTVPIMQSLLLLPSQTRQRSCPARRWRWRRARVGSDLHRQRVGPSATLSSRGRRGSLATRPTLWRARWKGPSRRASGGSRIRVTKLSTDGGDDDDDRKKRAFLLLFFLRLFCVLLEARGVEEFANAKSPNSS